MTMNDFSKKFICNSEDDTKLLAQAIASVAKKGDIFALYGTLGAGKSTFSRYFIQSLCNAEDVPSPTFTLVQTYETPDFDICHYDMYRLKKAEEAYELGVEDAFYQNVCLIEWPEKVAEILPRNIWKIDISANGNVREFWITVSDDKKAERLRSVIVD